MTEFEDQVVKLGLQQLAQLNPLVKEILEHNYALSVAAVNDRVVDHDRRLTVLDGKLRKMGDSIALRLTNAGEKFVQLEKKVKELEAELRAISKGEGG